MPEDNSVPLGQQEEALVRAFFVPEQRTRFLARLRAPKSRQKMLQELAHFHDLDARFAHRIPSRSQMVEGIYRLLREKGAPKRCYVLGGGTWDGQEVDLREALEEFVGVSFGTFLSCIPGKLAYFGGEEPNERYILER